MATGQARGFLRQLDGLLADGTAAGLTDGQLLERFSTRGGPAAEQAFAAIVERHGPMVLRVCRGVLGRSREQDAEDAFQATFLVLVRRARSLWVADSIGPWLHQVALRTASCARGAAARRRRHEAAGARPAEATVDRGDDGGLDDLGRILHEEIGRLPDRYRIPVVLCDLEGRTHEQAARHAGWPVGTVKSRLSRARERLKGRLSRRGVSPTAALVPAIRLGLDPEVPDALIRATTAAAVRLAATQTLAGTSAGLVAQGVLTAMARSSWWKVGGAILAAAATVSGARLVSGQATTAKPSDPPSARPPAAEEKVVLRPGPDVELATYRAQPGPFRATVRGRGRLEAIDRADVYSGVEGKTTIISLAPEGTRVKKGDPVAELDSATLRDQLVNQRIAIQDAQKAVDLADRVLQTAELALREYQQGILPRDRDQRRREVDLAAAEREAVARRIERARKGLEAMQRATSGKADTPTPADVAARFILEDARDRAEVDLQRAGAAIEAAKGRLAVLEQFEARKTTIALEAEVLKAQAARKAAAEKAALEDSRRAKLESQITHCKLLAPRDGRVVYANDPMRASGSPTAQIEEGATVRERQKLLSIVDAEGPLQVVAKLDEAMIDRVREGQKVQVRIDAFPDRRFAGLVVEVAPLPDPGSFFQSAKVYTTRIRLADTQAPLVPGMTADVEVLVAEREDALAIPAEAVLTYEAKDHLAVKRPDGSIELRTAELGDSTADADPSSIRVEVKAGLRDGEEVVLKPFDLLSDEQRRSVRLGAPTPPARPKSARGKRARPAR
ncbi:ECF RNA polymerase sigma factor SigE [Aquisphaera giovannonii]|uniref:ECF RNA polymerase sigma factor SigE n=1 Tax=Aquisphaera giovannonii TaxID=406548 RepID=A0A5B9VV56_9BACT|nr:sigma-70 family RNA polymerase sigma factor [Aquisphaera giovannonii]QEH32168.1 ECF RNA polymerase sigma factor SigE [Aquisphaera giovannonii]